MSRTRSLSKMFTAMAVWLAVLTFIVSGCGPVIFILDGTRATGACPWTDDDSAIACVSFRMNREPLPFGYSDGLSQRSHETKRSPDKRSI
jgi:hypothetical protein